jgi:Protein of unknown function (DUF2877)
MKSLPKLIRVCPQLNSFRPIKGFESTDYAYSGERIVWIGDDAEVRHPRNYWKPWQAPSKSYSAALLQAGAKLCLQQVAKDDTNDIHGLLLWLSNRAMPFPLDKAAPRFDAVRHALEAKQIKAFEEAALRVLGLGNGLTPSGDDFLGGIFFALAHKPYAKWLVSMPALQANIHKACEASTNPISAALLVNHISGKSFGELHDMLDALESNDSRFIENARQALLGVGSSSGADMLAGLLLALTTI